MILAKIVDSVHEANNRHVSVCCGKPFKTKGDAERHDIELHDRKKFLSCDSLTTYEMLFFEASTNPGQGDICRYCGEDLRYRTIANDGHFDWQTSNRVPSSIQRPALGIFRSTTDSGTAILHRYSVEPTTFGNNSDMVTQDFPVLGSII